MKRHYRLFIEDILDSINKINEFIRDMSFEEFLEDEKTLSAVILKIEIIGEATKNIPNTIRDEYPDLPWKDMAKLRDKIIHGYFGINYKIIWNVIKNRFPDIKIRIEDILKDLN